MPVEQARGWPDRQGPASDVFGLGGILCVLLTGCAPYAARDHREALARAAVGDLGDALARLDSSGADPALIRLARACLAVDPEDRIPDAGTVAESLGEYLVQVDRRLRSYGVEIRASEPADAARRLRRGALPIPLCGALDEWAMLREGAERSPLLETAGLVDPDPARNRIRRALRDAA